MTRIFLANPKNLRLVFPKEMTENVRDATLHSFIAIESAIAYATTIAHGDFPIVIYSFLEPDAVRVLSHEEDHRALESIGEEEASRKLDHPFVMKLLYHRKGAAYRRAYRRWAENQIVRASPKTEAR